MLPVKMSYPVTKAIIDQAHKHKLEGLGPHVYYLDDAKELVRQGVDGFAHIVRDKDVDKELLDKDEGQGGTGRSPRPSAARSSTPWR